MTGFARLIRQVDPQTIRAGLLWLNVTPLASSHSMTDEVSRAQAIIIRIDLKFPLFC